MTFGDMMSLLLTFFIMLASLSEVKKDEQFQALAESLRQQFGYDASPLSMSPGKSPPRNSAVSKLATTGREKRRDTMRGGDKTQAPTGDFSRVRIIRPGNNSGVGTAITFVERKAELNNVMRNDLQLTALELRGKPQRIEIRGHTSRKLLDSANVGRKLQAGTEFGLRAVLEYDELPDVAWYRASSVSHNDGGPQ